MRTAQKIIHLDDDLDIRNLINKRLGSLGYEVISLSEPDELINTILVSNAQVVILDINMPQADGLELLKQVKQFNGGVQVIMLTGQVAMMTVLTSMRRGAEACIFKPIKDLKKIEIAVANAFDKLERWHDTLEDLQRIKQFSHQASQLVSS